MIVLFATIVTFVGVVLPLFQGADRSSGMTADGPELTTAA
ncbi:Uncharacterised protein [Propionibacterium australiense]|uniref:Uncharacterized protein n=1 Tax=Propionibacterium australiense TaxID=119981 RepID=A0A383S7X5_9ACTN|nr:Hypothetical protein PROPAUS_1398 [Propionibacterium australiense]VEH91764.1 Uncharacterised protein [Propionibacterium australiense]